MSEKYFRPGVYIKEVDKTEFVKTDHSSVLPFTTIGPSPSDNEDIVKAEELTVNGSGSCTISARTIKTGTITTGKFDPTGSMMSLSYTGEAFESKVKRGLHINQDNITLYSELGTVIFTMDLLKGTVEFGKDFELDEATKLFWDGVGSASYGLVPRDLMGKLHARIEQLEEERKKDKALLSKALRELGNKYTGNK